MTSSNDTQDAVWMAEALEMARAAAPSGNTPVASVIVSNGVKIGVGGNQVTSQRNPILQPLEKWPVGWLRPATNFATGRLCARHSVEQRADQHRISPLRLWSAL